MQKIFLVLITVGVLSCLPASAQQKKTAPEPAANPARLEVYKLLRFFEGTWSVFENFQKGEFFPKGGTRSGTAKITPGPGRLSLIEDYHSSG